MHDTAMRSSDGFKQWQGSDRFIRSSHHKVRLQHFYQLAEHQANSEEDQLFTKKLYSLSTEAYKTRLSTIFSVPQNTSSWTPMWPVTHRKNPSIRSCDVVLDLPKIRTDPGQHPLDWGYKGQLTIALPRVIYLWHPSTDQTLKYAALRSTCVKWNNDGTDLFVSYRNGNFKLLDFTTSETKYVQQSIDCHTNCYVTAIAFNPKRRYFVIGCSRGVLTKYTDDTDASKIKDKTASHEPVTVLSFSCEGNQLAVSFISPEVKIFDADSFSLLLTIGTEAPSRAMSWHPWNKYCIVVGDLEGFIYVIDTKRTADAIMNAYVPSVESTIESLSFNPVTAELVVSQKIMIENINNRLQPFEETRLHVLASLDRVVDRMRTLDGRVPYLCWSPNGERIAVCGSDECVRIWCFLPPSEKRRVERVTPEEAYQSMYSDLARRLNMVLR